MFQLASVDWSAIFTPANMPFIAIFGCGTLVAVAGVIGGTWQKVRQHEKDVLLKRDLVAQGYSAEEIERIVRCRPGKK